MKEKWKDIKDYEGRYQVSNKGNVKSLDRLIEYSDGRKHRHKGKTLTKLRNNRGYLTVNLKKNNKGKRLYVHRLVAEAFIEESNLEVNHIDGDKTNNNADNLEWVTSSENTRHGYENGLFEKTRKAASERVKTDPRFDRREPIIVLDKRDNCKYYFCSFREGSKYFRQSDNYFTEMLRTRGGENGFFKVSRASGDPDEYEGFKKVSPREVSRHPKLTKSIPIAVYNKREDETKEFYSAKQAAEHFGYHAGYFSELINRSDGENKHFKATYMS